MAKSKKKTRTTDEKKSSYTKKNANMVSKKSLQSAWRQYYMVREDYMKCWLENHQLLRKLKEIQGTEEIIQFQEQRINAMAKNLLRNHPECSICSSIVDNPDTLFGQEECGHMFHADCFQEWEKTRPNDVSCPECRRVTTERDKKSLQYISKKK